MPLIQLDLAGSPYVGVFARANDRLAIVPSSVPDAAQAEVARALGVEVKALTLGGANILGSVVAMNSRGDTLVVWRLDRDGVVFRLTGPHIAPPPLEIVPQDCQCPLSGSLIWTWGGPTSVAAG